MSPDVGVVVPAYRPDAETLASYVDALREELDPAAVRIELDDPDGRTRAALEGVPATVHAVDHRRGKGAAITCGFEHLDMDVLTFADADASTPAASMADVVSPLLAGDADVAVGSRRHPDAVVETHQTLARRRLGDGFAWLARRLVEPALYDYQCGAKALTRRAWTSVREHLYAPGFAWDIELVAVAAALDHRVVEVPVTWRDKPDSTVSPVRTAADLALMLLRVRHRAKSLRGAPLHAAIDDRRPARIALIDRLTPEQTEE